MTQELNRAIEELYQTFSAYPFKSIMAGCPCCVSDGDKETIHSKQLRQLDGDDLSRYALKAMTTWGDTDDFKHYLPRIFELLATTDFIVDTFVVLGKLQYGKWRTWDENEQNAIESFLYQWWDNQLKNKSYFDTEPLFEIFKLTNDMDRLLDIWQPSFHNQSFLRYVDFVHDNYYDLVKKTGAFKKLDDQTWEKLLTWTRKQSPMLEKGFFHYEPFNKEVADYISTTLYIFERTT